MLPNQEVFVSKHINNVTPDGQRGVHTFLVSGCTHDCGKPGSYAPPLANHQYACVGGSGNL
jgi:hypothetical protein